MDLATVLNVGLIAGGTARRFSLAFFRLAPSLQPVYDWLEQVSSITYYQPNELQLLMQQAQATLPVGHCHSVAAGLGAACLVFPKPIDLFASMGPEITDRLASFTDELRIRPHYVDPAAIDGTYDRLAFNNLATDRAEDDADNPFLK